MCARSLTMYGISKMPSDVDLGAHHRRRQRHVERAELELLDHLLVAAELARAVDDDLGLAGELRVGALREFVGALLEQRAGLADVAELDLGLRERRRPRRCCAGAGGDDERVRAGSREARPRCDVSWVSPPGQWQHERRLRRRRRFRTRATSTPNAGRRRSSMESTGERTGAPCDRPVGKSEAPRGFGRILHNVSARSQGVHAVAAPIIGGDARAHRARCDSTGNRTTGVNSTDVQPLVFHPRGDDPQWQRLRGAIRGALLTDAASRGRYATDASIYQVEPLGVLVPAERRRRARGDRRVRASCACRSCRAAPAARSAARRSARRWSSTTASISNRVVAFDADARTVTVEPGIVLDALNAWLRPHGAVVSRSTSARRRNARSAAWRATTPAARARSRYGNMVHNVVAIDARLADGTEARFGPERDDARRAAARARPGRVAARDRRCASATRSSASCRRCCAASAATTSTSSIRRASGRTRADGSVNFAHLLVGSEGTLAWTRSADAAMRAAAASPRARRRQLRDRCTEAMDATRHIVALGPSAVELVDRTMIDLARDNPAFRAGDRARADRRAAGDPARRIHRRRRSRRARASSTTSTR